MTKPSNTRVYFNLHKKLLSIQAKVNGSWKVIRHVNEIMLADVKFKVYEKGRQRVLNEKRKNVHAFIVGNLVETLPCSTGMLFKDAQTMRTVREHEKFEDTWWCEGVDEEVGLWAYSTAFIISQSLLTTVRYNPYQLERFHDGTGYIDNAAFVKIVGRTIGVINK